MENLEYFSDNKSNNNRSATSPKGSNTQHKGAPSKGSTPKAAAKGKGSQGGKSYNKSGKGRKAQEAPKSMSKNERLAVYLAQALDGVDRQPKKDSRKGSYRDEGAAWKKTDRNDGGKKGSLSSEKPKGKKASQGLDSKKNKGGAKDAKAFEPKGKKTAEKRVDSRKSKDATPKAAPVKSPCPVDALCGGCANIAVPYKEQLKRKDAMVKSLLRDEGLLRSSLDLRPIMGMEDPYHYRNKVASPFARGKKLKDAKGKASEKDKGRRRKLDYEVLTGMYQTGTHNLINTEGCLIENQLGNRVIKVIKNLVIHHGIQPYDEDSGTGFLRHAIVRIGHNSGEALVTLVTNQREFPSSKAFCRELVSRCPFVTTVVQNINTRQTNVILGEEEQVLYGPGFILDTLCGLSFRISSQSFYQVNAVQTEVLYNTALELAGLTGTETVIDAYCGTGTIGLVAAKNGAASVIGVDNVADAIRDARTNAHHNGIENSLFLAGDAGDAMKEWAAEDKLDPAQTVLMMDPPRAGSSEAFLQAACQLSPARIVYISCNPVTQMRDLRFLVSKGYKLKVVQPVDMFPQTDHVESIALLTRANPSK